MSDVKKLTPHCDGKRRKMQLTKLTAIALTVQGANPDANVTFFKSKKETVVEKNADVLTGVAEGHQHGIEVEVYDSQLYLYIGRGLAKGETENHSHEIVFNYETGSYEMSMNAGHTHTVDTASLQTVLVNRFSKSNQANTTTKEKALTLTAAAIGGTPVHKEEIPMPEINQAEHDTALATIVSLKKSLAIAVALGSLTDVQKSYHNTLSDDDQTTFLGKSVSERSEVLEKALEANAVVFTSKDGAEFRKSDDPRMVAMAKRADASDAALLKAQEVTEDLALEKRASAEFANLPGEMPAQKALLKAVATISDETIRADVESILKASNSSFHLVTKTYGSSAVNPEAGNAEAEMDLLAKAHVQANPAVSYVDAYDVVATTNPELYNKAVAG